MARHVFTGLLCSLLAAISSQAHAQSQGADAASVFPPVESYLQLSVGEQKLNSTSSTGTAMDLNGSGTSAAIRLVIGAQFNKYLGLEGAWYQLPGSSVRTPSGEADYSGSVVAASVTLKLPVHDRLDVVARAGVGHSSVDVAVPTMAYRSDSHQSLAVWGLGARYKFNESVAMTVDYDDLGKIGKYARGDHVKLSMLSVGMQIKF